MKYLRINTLSFIQSVHKPFRRSTVHTELVKSLSPF